MMPKKFNKNYPLYAFFAAVIFMCINSSDLNAQQSSNASNNSESSNLAPTRKYKKARALQSSTAKKNGKSL